LHKLFHNISSNLPAPINEGPDPQTKAGNLTIEGNLTTGGFTMSAGAEANKVLTTNASGVATWQTPAGGGEVLWSDVTSKPTTVAGYGITDMGSQNVNYAATAGSVSNIGDKSCAWVATAQAAANYSCGTGKYMRGLRFAEFVNNSSHSHTGLPREFNVCTQYPPPACSTGATGSGPATIYLVTAIECCTL